MVKSQRTMNKGAWSAEEDRRLSECIKIHGDKKWKTIPARAGLNRCGKSCRLRWLNYLRPDIKRGNISEDEEDLIMRLHNLLGNRWSLIAGRLPGRTDNEIKNYWNTSLCKKSLSMNELNDKNKSNDNRSQKSLPTCTAKAGPVVVSSNPGETNYEKGGELQSQRPWLADHMLVQDLDFDLDADIDRFFYFAGSDKKVWEMNGGMFFSEMLDYGLQMPFMELEFCEPNFYQNEFGSFELTARLRDGYEQPSSL